MKADTFNKGYDMTELLAAAELDMQWHSLPPDAPLEKSDEFERQALESTHLNVSYVPPRYRSSYFSHIWGGRLQRRLLRLYLDRDARRRWLPVVRRNGGFTRANGDRFRQMVLSHGDPRTSPNVQAWRGAPPNTKAMLKYRGLEETPPAK